MTTTNRESLLNTTIAIAMLRRFAATCLAATACCAVAAPVTIPINYPSVAGYAATGSVTYDDAIQVPETLTGGMNDTTGLIAMNLTVTGPGLPGGTTSFTLADLDGWYFSTNSSSSIVDLNFFGHPNGAGCTIFGVEVFQLAVFCGGGDPENPLVVLNLNLNSSGPTAPTVAVPTLAPLPLASLSIVLAALALVSLAVARRRARRG
jgi:hypothetical protein